MKITVIKDSCTNHKTSSNLWSYTGGCFFKSACHSCWFFKYTEGIVCAHLREKFIAYTDTGTYPYTFDTDDYPELLI